jgi:ATP-binding cassette subfamily F protein uup
LDEPTNDLDLQTLRTLEEFLLDYPGCILIVSHDRYFMDRLVDHLFVMEGDGIVRDFPGNYTQYRLSESQVRKKNQEERNHPATPEAKQEETSMRSPKTERLSFKEKFEKEQIEKELPLLIAEKKRLETLLETETAYAALEKTANRISELIQSIDRLEFRWLELSEKSE